MRPIENTILIHCAPVLCKVKPAAIITCNGFDAGTVEADLATVRRELSRQGCLVVECCRCQRSVSLFIYHRWLLTAFLNVPGVPRFLAQRGYPVEAGIDDVVGMLVKRYRECGTVPHEIGLFLGYPLEDVMKFEEYKGRQYQICRYWKVYADVEQAKKVFECYDQCRSKLCGLMEKGLTFSGVLKEIA